MPKVFKRNGLLPKGNYLFGLTTEQREKLDREGRIWMAISEDPI